MRRFSVVVGTLLIILTSVLMMIASVPTVLTGTWKTWDTMSSARSGASAVLLSDGRVLIAGGSDSNGPVNSVDLFGADGRFSSAQPMNSPRSSYAATILQDGRVLVTGGINSGGGISNSAEIYDPSADAWTLLSSVMVDARSGHTASLLQDGRVLLAGGENSGGAVSSAEIFDPANNNFSSAGTMSSPRMNHGASVLPDGRVLVIGGSDGTNPLNTSDIYDPSSGSISAGPNLSVARTAASVSPTLDGRVIVIGGNNGSTDLASAEIFDPATGQFTLSSSSLVTARSGQQSFLLPKNNSIFVLGGTSAGSDLNSAELYYPWADTFQATGSMSVARPGVAGSFLSLDGRLLAAGGSGLSSTELYGFATVKTDASDYPPGTQVNISGSGWQPGETVTLTLVEVPYYDSHGPFTAVADANGNISNGSFVTDQYDARIRFYLTAVGSNSGVQAQNTFTDAPRPQTTITFPANNGSYNTNGWTTGAPIAGTVTFAAGTSRGVNISIKRNSTNQYWSGTAFNNSSEQFFAATLNGGQTVWSLNFTASNFPADGSYTVRSQGIDSNGNEPGSTTSTFSFDNSPPAAPANLTLASSSDNGASQSDGITNVTSNLRFNGTAEANSAINLYVDGSGTSAGSGVTGNGGNWNNINIPGPLSEGLHSVRATATDAAGNASSLSTALGITIDTTPPSSGLSPAAGTYTAPFSIQWSITDPTSGGVSSGVNTSTCKVTVNGSQVATSCSGTQSLSPGTRTVIVSATDIAGNTLSDSRTYTVNADNTPPLVSVSFGAPDGQNNWYVHSPVIGTVTADDTTTGGSNVTALSCTGATVGSITGLGTTTASASLTVSAEGSNNVSCTATDSASNTGAGPGSANSATVKIDTVKPALAASRITAPNGNGWNNTDVKVEFSCSDATSGVASVNAAGSGSGNSSTSPLDVNVSGEGQNQTVTGSCTDAAGNSASAASISDISIDKTAPSLTATAKTADNNAYTSGVWTNQTVTVHFACSDGLSGVDTVTPDASVASEGQNQSAPGSCTDKAGNSSNASFTGIDVDKTPPTIAFVNRTAANGAGWNNTDVTVNWSCSDTLSGPVNASVSSTVATEGQNQSSTGTCQDNAGNIASNTQTGISIDKTPPTVHIAADRGADHNGWYNHSLTFSNPGTDSLSGIASCTVPAAYSGPDSATSSVSASCTDNAGNTGTGTFSFMYDGTPPTSVSGGPNRPPDHNAWYNHAVDVVFTGNDVTSGIESCSTVNYSGPDTATAQANGTCTDNAGNTSSPVASSSFKFDSTPPTATLSVTAGTLGAHGWYTSDVTISTSGHDSVSDPTVCTGDQFQTTETIGLVFNGSCTNDAGLTTNATALTVKLDKTPPTGVTLIATGTLGLAGWYTSDVTIQTSGSETISNPILCTDIQSLTTDTTGQLFQGSCTNDAGLLANAVDITIKRDATPPAVHITPDRVADHNNWYNHSLTFTNPGTDSTSGIASCTTPAVYSGPDNAAALVSASCTDNAGNTGNGSFSFMYDATPPTIAFANRVPAANVNGWNNTDVTVSWNCSDGLSGAATPTVNQVVSSEGQNQSAMGTCQDNAGNSASNTQNGINIDKTAPTLTFGSQSPAANGSGWNNTNVSFGFTTADTLSGVASTSSSSPIVLSAEGFAVTGSITVTDKAGNSATFITPSVKIDKTAPTVTCDKNISFLLNQPGSAVTGTVTDSLSGPLSSPISTPVADNTAGINFTGTITGYDVAGNSNSASCTYNVSYARLTAFLQPWGPPGAVAFKIKSTVPLKWQYTDYNGNVVNSANANPTVFDAGSCGPGASGDAALDYAGNSGYQYDPISNTWQFNWKTTGSSPGCHAIEVTSGLTKQTDGYFPTDLR